MTASPSPERARPRWYWLLAIGIAAGFLSGLFGVGGGVIVVPLLVLLGVDQRRAAGVSVAAIAPVSLVGAIGYGISGDIDWIAAALLAIGVVVGAQLGTMLLARIPTVALFWGFVAFMAAVAVSLWWVVPERGVDMAINAVSIAALIVVGLVTGILSGLLGVGGGIIVVPILMLAFGASDLTAKGTSLAMMVPGSISATIGNLRRGNTDLRMALVVGLAACAASPLGIWLAIGLDPLWANIAFSVFIVAVAVQMVVRRLRQRPSSGPSAR